MKLKRKPFLLLTAVLVAASSMYAQQSTVPEMASAIGQSVASASGEKASIYVYRSGSIVGLAVSPAIFVNNGFLAVLNNSRYAKVEVPPGSLVVGATTDSTATEDPSTYVRLSQYLPPTLRWPKCEGDVKKSSCSWDASLQSEKADDHGCAKIDWQHVDDATPEDLALCGRELSSTSAALENWLDPGTKSTGILLGLMIPGPIGNNALANSLNLPGGEIKAWLQMCGPNPFPARTPQEAERIKRDSKRGDDSDYWNRCKSQAAAADVLLQIKKRVRIQAEAGKTYYVKWSAVSGSGGKMILVDDTTGTKEIKGLHPAEAPPAPRPQASSDATGPPEATPLSLNLITDSAATVGDTGLVLLLKHMGFAATSADLYVVSGKPDMGEPLHAYTNDRATSDEYIARFSAASSPCNGTPTKVDGYQVWCFRVKETEISRKRDKAQSLGIVTSNGRRFNVQAVDFHIGGGCKARGVCYGVDAEVREAPSGSDPAH